MPDPGDATVLLQRLASGDPAAASELFPLVYAELHRLAERQMASERKDHTLQPTALVHEAYLRLAGGEPAGIADRQHFLCLAARAMRSVLVDHARSRGADKRGGKGLRVTLHDGMVTEESQGPLLLALDDALAKLGGMDEQLARIVELKFFGGLTIDQTAAALQVSTPTVERGWRLARAWLQGEVGNGA